MADKPILFSAPMVRALLAGTKTQTRRVHKPQPFIDANGNFCVPRRKGGHWNYGQHIDGSPCVRNFAEALRIKVGDQLWVRENIAISPRTAWALPKTISPDDPDMAAYYQADFDRSGRPRWKPCIHMPRWASRLTLTVTDVRVQRLQQISEADAIAEGVERLNKQVAFPIYRDYCALPKSGPGSIHSAWASYRTLWDQINGPGSWDANPWVAAYTFTVERSNIDKLGRAA